jgi:hypothetical protein
MASVLLVLALPIGIILGAIIEALSGNNPPDGNQHWDLPR